MVVDPAEVREEAAFSQHAFLTPSLSFWELFPQVTENGLILKLDPTAAVRT